VRTRRVHANAKKNKWKRKLGLGATLYWLDLKIEYFARFYLFFCYENSYLGNVGYFPRDITETAQDITETAQR